MRPPSPLAGCSGRRRRRRWPVSAAPVDAPPRPRTPRARPTAAERTSTSRCDDPHVPRPFPHGAGSHGSSSPVGTDRACATRFDSNLLPDVHADASPPNDPRPGNRSTMTRQFHFVGLGVLDRPLRRATNCFVLLHRARTLVSPIVSFPSAAVCVRTQSTAVRIRCPRSASPCSSSFPSGVVGAFVRSRPSSMSGRGGGGRGGYGGRLARLRARRHTRLGTNCRTPKANRVVLTVGRSVVGRGRDRGRDRGRGRFGGRGGGAPFAPSLVLLPHRCLALKVAATSAPCRRPKGAARSNRSRRLFASDSRASR